MKSFFVVVGLSSLVTLWAADPVPMNVKVGEWESTVTSQVSGIPAAQIPQIPPEQLARIPPEQRARIEAAMKQAGGAPRTTTTKHCVKKEDLTKMPLADRQNCKTTVLSSSATKQELRMECDIQGTKTTANATFEATGPDSVKFNVQAASGEKGSTFNMNVNGTSKWLGPTCTEN